MEANKDRETDKLLSIIYNFQMSDHLYITDLAGAIPSSPSRKALSERLYNLFQLAFKFLAQLSFLIDLGEQFSLIRS